MQTKQILIITSSTDATATYLCEIFEKKSIEYHRFDTEFFPNDWMIHWEVPKGIAYFSSSSKVIDTAKIGSVWYRRPSSPGISFSITEPAARTFARRECEETLSAVWNDLEVLWVNHPNKIRDASKKPHQLKTASRLGIKIPETILSSEQDLVHKFWVKHHGQVIFKSLHQDAIEVEGRNYFAYTTFLTAERLSDLTRLSLAPVLFQQYIRPKLEIRVTVIGDSVFAASLDTSKQENPDWRRVSPDRQDWRPYELPREIQGICHTLISNYSIRFGAIDLILSEQDEYYFLELNPNGQWVWIELITAMPLSSAMVKLLTDNL